MRAPIALVLITVLAGCGTADRPVRHAAPPATQAAENAGLCDVRVVVDVAGREVPVSRTSTEHVEVRVGDVVRVRATGSCASTVSATPQNGRLEHTTNRIPSFRAVRSGSVRLLVAMPMCARPRGHEMTGCLGGIAELGSVAVTVTGTGRGIACGAITYAGRTYEPEPFRRDTMPGVGRPLGRGIGHACGAVEERGVRVYSYMEAAPSESITVSDGQVVRIYDIRR